MQLLFTMRLSLAARFSVIIGLSGFFSFHASAQQLKLGDNPSVLKKDAILELNSTNQGLLLPRVLKSQISTGGKLFNADNGMFVFVSDESSLYVKRSGIWQKVGDLSATAIVGDVDVTGSGTLTTTIKNKAVTYAKMQDVTTQSLLGRYAGADGVTQEIKIGSNLLLNTTTGVLSADANTAWWNASLLQGKAIAATAPATGDVLKWNSVSNSWEPAAIAALTTTLTGDVTGSGSGAFATTVANKAVTFAKFQDVNTQTLLGRYSAASGAVQEVTLAGGNLALSAAGLLSASNGTALWNANKLQGRDIVTTAPANGDVLKYNTTTNVWEPAAAAAVTTTLTGDVTGTGTGSFATTVANKAITFAKFQDIGTQTLLGRYATGAGTAQQITLGTNLALSPAGVLSAGNTSAIWNASQLQGRNVGTTTPTTGYVLKWNGTAWDAAADGGSGMSALTGDVTASGTGSVTATIAAKAVTYAKMQDVTASSLLGRYSATNGVTQEIKIGGNLAFNTTTGTLSAAGITALTGDVTAATTTGSAATTIAAKAVTYAKFQDIPTQTLLGRYSTGTGVTQEVKITGGNLLLNNTTGILSADNNSAIWNTNKILSRTISTNTPANGDVLKFNNATSTWEPSADLSGGATYGTLANNDISQADAPDAFSRMKIWASPATGTVTNGPLGTGAYSWNVLSFKGNGYTTQLYFDKSTLGVKEWGGNTATLTTNAGNPWYKMVMVHGDANIDNGAIIFGGKTEDASSEVKTDAAKLFWNNTTKRLGVGTATPNSTFTVNGSTAEALTINTNQGTQNLDETMSTVVIRRTGNNGYNVNVYLPTPSTCPGRKYTIIRDYSNSWGDVVVRATAGDPAFTYNGSTNFTMGSNTAIIVQSIGTRWVAVSVTWNI